jgi:hypothetical protein
MVWPLLTVALSLAVATCSAGDAGQPQPRPQQSPQARAAERGTQPTTPAASAGTETPEQAAARTAREGTPSGDVVEVRRAWVQVRKAPALDAQAIALAFGNDRFAVVEQQGDWVRVKLAGNREGWIPFETTQEP